MKKADKPIEKDFKIIRADKKKGKNIFMGKLISNLTLEEIEDYSKQNKGMEFSIEQLYTAKLEERIDQKLSLGEKPEDIKKWLGEKMSVRKVDKLDEIHQNKKSAI